MSTKGYWLYTKINILSCFTHGSPSQVGVAALHTPTPSPLPSIHVRVESAELKPVPLAVQANVATVPDLYTPLVLERVL